MTDQRISRAYAWVPPVLLTTGGPPRCLPRGVRRFELSAFTEVFIGATPEQQVEIGNRRTIATVQIFYDSWDEALTHLRDRIEALEARTRRGR